MSEEQIFKSAYIKSAMLGLDQVPLIQNEKEKEVYEEIFATYVQYNWMKKAAHKFTKMYDEKNEVLTKRKEHYLGLEASKHLHQILYSSNKNVYLPLFLECMKEGGNVVPPEFIPELIHWAGINDDRRRLLRSFLPKKGYVYAKMKGLSPFWFFDLDEAMEVSKKSDRLALWIWASYKEPLWVENQGVKIYMSESYDFRSEAFQKSYGLVPDLWHTSLAEKMMEEAHPDLRFRFQCILQFQRKSEAHKKYIELASMMYSTETFEFTWPKKWDPIWESIGIYEKDKRDVKVSKLTAFLPAQFFMERHECTYSIFWSHLLKKQANPMVKALIKGRLYRVYYHPNVEGMKPFFRMRVQDKLLFDIEFEPTFVERMAVSDISEVISTFTRDPNKIEYFRNSVKYVLSILDTHSDPLLNEMYVTYFKEMISLGEEGLPAYFVEESAKLFFQKIHYSRIQEILDFIQTVKQLDIHWDALLSSGKRILSFRNSIYSSL